MTLPENRRPFRAPMHLHQKNLEGSAATFVVPAMLTPASGREKVDGVAIMRGGFFTGVLTLEDARRIADSIHDLLDAVEPA